MLNQTLSLETKSSSSPSRASFLCRAPTRNGTWSVWPLPRCAQAYVAHCLLGSSMML